MPTSWRSVSQTRIRRTDRSRISVAASVAVEFCSIITISRVVTEPSVVCRASLPSATARITMSRSVTMPNRFDPSVTTTSPMSASRIARAASSSGVPIGR